MDLPCLHLALNRTHLSNKFFPQVSFGHGIYHATERKLEKVELGNPGEEEEKGVEEQGGSRTPWEGSHNQLTWAHRALRDK